MGREKDYFELLILEVRVIGVMEISTKDILKVL